ncbi:MAG TPA: DUF3566 domain-containing protein [Acidimicrobiales bacterium]|nr:DUF3566 domain-containing protein [Acidimicrobiales bacterium]
MSLRPRPAPFAEPGQPGGDGSAAAPRGPAPAPGNGPQGAPPGALATGRTPTVSTRRGGRTVLYDDQARKPRRRGPAPSVVEVRRVRRVLRRVDVWSVFRFAFLLYLCGAIVIVAAGVGLWLLASGAGAIPNIEHFITQLFALKRFTFKPGQMFLGLLGVCAVWVFVATLTTVLGAVLFNLISDVVGGIELTVLEEDPVAVEAARSRADAPRADGPVAAPARTSR